MAQHPLSCSWRPGTLRPFESEMSFGSKYCYLNRIRFSELEKSFTDFLPLGERNPHDGCYWNVDSFDFDALARYLGEPSSLVNTLSLKKIKLGPYQQKLCVQDNESEYNYKDLIICPTCLANGYHSSLHQMRWLDKCFIHGTILEGIYGFLSAEFKSLNQRLFNVWFRPDRLTQSQARWLEATSPIWTFNDHKLIHRAALTLISKLQATERRLSATNPQKLIGHGLGGRVAMTMNAVKVGDQKILNLLNKRQLKLKPYHFCCSPEDALTILNLTDHELSLLMQARQVMCDIFELRPQWKSVLNDLESNLIYGHEHCLKLLHGDELYGQAKRLAHAFYIKEPFSKDFYASVPCNRLATINCLKYIIDLERENIFSNVSLKELSLMENIRNLISTGLVDPQSGCVHRNGHKLFVFEMRYCKFLAPSGILVPVIDEMILAHVWSWCWTLFFMEQEAEHIPNSSPLPALLSWRIKQLSPLSFFQQEVSGLMMTVGSYVPFESPPWKKNLVGKQKHAQEVTKIFNSMLEHFYGKLDNSWKQFWRQTRV